MASKPLALIGLLGLLACRRDEPASDRVEALPVTSSERESPPQRIDVHVHLVDGQRDALLAALDRKGIAAAVVVASPHLDARHGVPLDDSGLLRGWRDANARLLDETKDHRDRLWPFVTVEPSEVEIAELERWFAAGACGVKLYFGHQRLHARPLDDPQFTALFEWLASERIPLLAHVNTVRYRDELAALLRRHPDLALICPHLCGSRTDVDRLAGLLREFPRLRVDTSHGGGIHGTAGFTAIEEQHERVRALILAEPERFAFGSDLVTTPSHEPEQTRVEWDLQLDANLGLLERERFTWWREQPEGGLVLGEFRGFALPAEVRERVLGGNASEWLTRCRPAD